MLGRDVADSRAWHSAEEISKFPEITMLLCSGRESS